MAYWMEKPTGETDHLGRETYTVVRGVYVEIPPRRRRDMTFDPRYTCSLCGEPLDYNGECDYCEGEGLDESEGEDVEYED